MALGTMIKELTAAKAAYDKKLAELGDDTQKAIAEFLKPHIPEGFGVQWHMYTPYFNDGEPCVFRMGVAYLIKLIEENRDKDGKLQIVDRYGEEAEVCVDLSCGERYGATGNTSITKTRLNGTSYTYDLGRVEPVDGVPVDQFRALSEAFNSIPEDMHLAAWDDHSNVLIAFDGSYVRDEFSHD